MTLSEKEAWELMAWEYETLPWEEQGTICGKLRWWPYQGIISHETAKSMMDKARLHPEYREGWAIWPYPDPKGHDARAQFCRQQAETL